MFSDTGDDHAAIRMAHEDDLIEIFPFDLVDDVADVCRQVNLVVQEMRALAETGQCRRKDTVFFRSQAIRDPLPTPATMARAMHQNERRRRVSRRTARGQPKAGHGRSRRHANAENLAARRAFNVACQHVNGVFVLASPRYR